MDLRGVFNSEPKSLFDTLSEAGLCFYLPAYQRPYTWTNKNVDRVFEDVVHGLENAVRNDDAITFIGTILTIHDTKYQTIVPHKKGEVPAKVMLVIDGQQRLTTMLIIITALYDQMRYSAEALTKKLEGLTKIQSEGSDGDGVMSQADGVDWLIDKINQETANLRYFATDTNSNKDKIYRWYPKIIRAYKDCWSKTQNGAQYESPIAAYLHAFNKHVLECEEGGNYKRFKYAIDKDQDEYDRHQLVVRNLKIIKKHIVAIASGGFGEDDQPALKELMEGKFKESFQFDIPNVLLTAAEDDTHLLHALNLVVFTKYFLGRVCVTYVTVTDEAYAFDMFEALNTTGEPLTSIETFKPKVIETEGLSAYEASESKKHFDIIDYYLDAIPDAARKHRETTRLMLTFALAETGEKISKHISDQRRYLLESYKEEQDTKKSGFVRNLAYVTKFYFEEWDADQPNIFSDPHSEKNELLLCLDVLRASKHDITSPFLVRYFGQVIEASDKKSQINELKSAIKGIVAFFVLWRAAHRGTAGIDSVYRDLLRNGDAELGVDGFCRSKTNTVSAKPLLLSLRDRLKTKLKATDENLKEAWLNQAAKVPVYEISTPLTRIMMLAAFEDTCPSDAQPGLIEKGTVGSSPMLSWHKWKRFKDESSNDQFTLEHIAPQTLSEEWAQSLLENQELLNTIGNLTILPKRANSSASNKSWAEKRKYYMALCSESQQKKKRVLEELEVENQKIILEEAHYFGFLEPISKVEQWDAEFIVSRSRNLLSHIWDRFEKWI